VVTRGEVWLARLDPTEGRELQKTRPCLVISPPEIHDHLDIVIVVPMTTRSHPAPFRIEAKLGEKEGRFLLEQIRTLDKSRLLRPLDAIDRRTVASVLRALRQMFAE
jgi:mRNA interferase MazF